MAATEVHVADQAETTMAATEAAEAAKRLWLEARRVSLVRELQQVQAELGSEREGDDVVSTPTVAVAASNGKKGR
jgi:hypothetical protein